MKAYVISLERSVERRLHIERQCKKLQLDYEIVDAVDGSSLTQADISRISDSEAVEGAPRWLSPSAIACAASHQLVYSRILSDGLKAALVLEDDMILSDLLPKAADELPGELWDTRTVVLFYYRSPPSGRTVRLAPVETVSLLRGCRLAAPLSLEDVPFCGGAYMISSLACEAFLAHHRPIAFTADSWDSFLGNRWINHLFVVYPRLARGGARFKSTIDYLGSYHSGIASRLSRIIASFPLFKPLFWVNRFAIERKMSRFILLRVQSLPLLHFPLA